MSRCRIVPAARALGTPGLSWHSQGVCLDVVGFVLRGVTYSGSLRITHTRACRSTFFFFLSWNLEFKIDSIFLNVSVL